jgi:hypothetical protein
VVKFFTVTFLDPAILDGFTASLITGSAILLGLGRTVVLVVVRL